MKGERASAQIRAKLKAVGITRIELAKLLEVDPSTASLMMNGKRGFPHWHHPAIAKWLKTHGADFPRIEPEHGVEQLTSAITSGSHDGAAPLPTHTNLYEELSAASRDFLSLSLLCRKWYERLADLAGDIAGRQTASARANRPVVDDGSGAGRGSDARTRPRRRKAS